MGFFSLNGDPGRPLSSPKTPPQLSVVHFQKGRPVFFGTIRSTVFFPHAGQSGSEEASAGEAFFSPARLD
jgi:hypothetical protein